MISQEDEKEIINGKEEIKSSRIKWPDGTDLREIQIGYTYKASTIINKILFTDDILDSVTGDSYIRIGDLLIATGTEGPDGYISSDTLKWTHISAGYRADYVPELSANSVKNNDNVVLGAEIKLTSAHANDGTGDLGIVSVVSNNESLTVDADSNAIKIGMVWGTF